MVYDWGDEKAKRQEWMRLGAKQELEMLLKEAWFVTGEGMNKIDGNELHEYILKRLAELK